MPRACPASHRLGSTPGRSAQSVPAAASRRGLRTWAQQQQQQAEGDPAAAAAAAAADVVPPNCSRYKVSLTKPLGLVLEEDKSSGSIVVAEIIEGGAGERAGLIALGDALISTSGYTRTSEQVYGEIVVRGGEQMVRLAVRGESFDTVLAAIGSVPGAMQVELEFQRCAR
jgi:hypothetical protein